MSIERKVVVDSIEINRNGTTGVRLAILLVEDGNEIDCKWLRTVIDGEVTAEAQMQEVNDHLASMGFPAVSAEDVAIIATYDRTFAEDKDAKRQERLAKIQQQESKDESVSPDPIDPV